MPPDRWLALTVRLPPAGSPSPVEELARDLVPQLLVELGGRGVEEAGDEYVTFLPPPSDLEGFLGSVRARVWAVTGGKGEVSWDWQPHEDWEVLWRIGLGPRRITDRLVVAPSWEVPEVEGEDILLLLDPGMAFGTAEHATTRGCLRLLDGRVGVGDRIADIGSGSGILSIAAARMGAGEVVAVEMDPVACEVALENLERNDVLDRVRVVEEELTGEAPLPDGPYEGLVANIQRTVLIPLFPSFRLSVRPGGWLILSGILQEEVSQVLEAASGEGFFLEEEDREGEWWSGAFSLPALPG